MNYFSHLLVIHKVFKLTVSSLTDALQQVIQCQAWICETRHEKEEEKCLGKILMALISCSLQWLALLNVIKLDLLNVHNFHCVQYSKELLPSAISHLEVRYNRWCKSSRSKAFFGPDENELPSEVALLQRLPRKSIALSGSPCQIAWALELHLMRTH